MYIIYCFNILSYGSEYNKFMTSRTSVLNGAKFQEMMAEVSLKT